LPGLILIERLQSKGGKRLRQGQAFRTPNTRLDPGEASPQGLTPAKPPPQKYGYSVPPEMVASFQFELERDYEQAVRTQLAKEEQARIRELMREEARGGWCRPC
jgi:hypothetical protein